MRLTHVGGPTVLIELDGWRILTDPTFDAPGRTYRFGWGTSSRKTAGPAVEPDRLAPFDVVLLSHDHHADNLDDRGRECLPAAGTVVTTAAGARRLPDARGLRVGRGTTVTGPGRPPLRITATPCRHGPPLSRPVAGPVIGFLLATGDAARAAVWITGDTVLHRPVRRLADRLDVDVLVLHLGRVRFPGTGPVRYSMDGRDAVELVRRTGARVAVPVHYEGWSHFSEPEAALRDRLTGSPVRWLTPGEPTEV